ncbi:hypothetical protein [Burkholderia lata]|uniref:hypothetical protein n=1 Tax=Burkholderia lata (strain ATCC 17760 / DSM 23089 / LMG 22485 / NCIMB 9086 / R18194 / 383) TaxID=482957 RepID=UPI0015816471|nr:hypothetical protein [Burkholderia lata]
MNKLPRPAIDDIAALQRLASNRRAHSFPKLQRVVQVITHGYAQYLAEEGDARHINRVELDEEVEGYLRAHYKNPPSALAYITALRHEAEQRACPMCGSMHRGTLDHLLPKEDYAVFAVFSQNLVPACKCNSKRGRTVVGVAAGERILHPYFDNCLQDRLIVSHFDDLGLVPSVNLRILADEKHPRYLAIAFHVRHIVSNSAIRKYLSDKWVHLCQLPELAVRALGVVPENVDELRQLLERELELTDRAHGGKNNWNSVFVAGLLDAHVLLWLFERLAAPGRGPKDPLL